MQFKNVAFIIVSKTVLTFVLSLLLVAAPLAQTVNIGRIEYFIDTDPGYGKATPLTFTPSAQLQELPININPAGLSNGVHQFTIRTADANGNWSFNQRWLFIKPFSSSSDSSALANIKRIEYFLDADPGYGNATAVSFTGSINLDSLLINIDPSTLTNGVHQFNVRAADANGKWSFNQRWLFIKPFSSSSDSSTPANIKTIEYFLDADPGYGKATAVSFTSSINLDSLLVNINPSTLTTGVHQFNIRAADANGNWSFNQRYLLLKPYDSSSGELPKGNIVYGEWYLDNDPGYGAASKINVSAAPQINDLLINVGTDTLAEGVHQFNVRVKDEYGRWSVNQRLLFFKPFSSSDSTRKTGITYLEYYIDDDPGFGKGTAINTVHATDIADIHVSADISSLGIGTHFIYIRGRDSSGNWSMTNATQFEIKPPSALYVKIGTVPDSVCAGSSLQIPFTVNNKFNPDNIFTAELSNSSGEFTDHVSVGSVASDSSATIDAIIPSDIERGSTYHFRIISSSPKDTSGASATNTKIKKVPGNDFSITGNTNTCEHAETYSPDNIETDVIYHWALSGGGILDTTTLPNTAIVNWNQAGAFTLKVFASGSCGNSAEKAITVTVSGSVPSSAPVISNTGRTLFIVNPDQSFTYQWYKNGTAIDGADQNFYLAESSGTYTAKYINNCGTGNASNQITFSKNSQTQIITFNSIAPKTFGDSAFVLRASSSSSLPLTFTIIEGPAVIHYDTLIIQGAGSITIQASQSGDSIYSPAESVQQTVMVKKAGQTISFEIIPDKRFEDSAFVLSAKSSVGLTVNFDIESGPASVSGNTINITGVGQVLVKAQQDGNQNYAGALAEQTFCISPIPPDTIKGFKTVCISDQEYFVDSIPGASYKWSISGGGDLLNNNNADVTIRWKQKGSFTITVQVSGNCNNTDNISKEINVEVTDPLAPATVTNMYPPGNTLITAFPFSLSWQPASGAQLYDLKIWADTADQPVDPIVSNLSVIGYPMYQGYPVEYRPGLKYNWQVISKNACKASEGPIQSFTVNDLPNLYVKNLVVPDSIFSGQVIDVVETIGNNGKASTGTSQWIDAVYLSADSILNLNADTYLIGANNQSVLDAGSEYTNTISALLPENKIGKYYIILVTNAYRQLSELSAIDDTAIKAIPIILTPPPDLQVTSVITPADAFTATNINVTYTVRNKGIGITKVNRWTDKIYISPDSAFDVNTSRLLDSIPHYADSLRSDSSYTRTASVLLPSRFFGRQFIHVLTDANNTVYEFTFENNNNNRSDSINVFLTPPPDFIVAQGNLPDSGSSGENIHVNYSIKNVGATRPLVAERSWLDGIFISKDSVFNFNNARRLAYTFPLTRSEEHICSGQVVAAGGSSSGGSSAGQGSNPGGYIFGGIGGVGTGTAKPGCIEQGSNNITTAYITPDKLLYIGDYVCGVASYYPYMDYQETYNNNIDFVIPDTIAGTYYLYLYTDFNDSVFEYQKEDNNTIRAKVEIKNPDLTITGITTADTAFSGTNTPVSWTVYNQGKGKVFGTNRKDLIWLSKTKSYDMLNAIRIDSLIYCNEIANESSIVSTKSIHIPDGLSGQYYLFIEADIDHQVYEGNNDANNYFSKALYIKLTPWADLKPSDIDVNPDSTYMEQNLSVHYNITNSGIGDLSGKLWKERLYISAIPQWDTLASVLVREYTRTQALPIGSSYEVSDSIAPSVQTLAAAHIDSSLYYYLYVDPSHSVYEYTGENNNIKRSNVVHVFQPDLKITTISGPDSAYSGLLANVSWSVKNIGARTGLYTSAWDDAIYLSKDTILDANDTFVTDRHIPGPLLRDGSYQQNMALNIPNGIFGKYYLFTNTDYNNSNRDKNRIDNVDLMRDESRLPKPLYITLTKSPDLVVAAVTNNSVATAGQPLLIKWIVKNNGVGPTRSGAWTDRIYLSNNPSSEISQTLLGSLTHRAIVNAGASYSDSLLIFIPISEVGNYYLLIKTDANDDEYEYQAEGNNIGSNTIFVVQPPPSDLVVTSVSVQDTATIGDSLNITWTIKNIGINPANGYFKEGIFISSVNLSDSNEIFLVDTAENINLPPQSSITKTKKIKLNGFTPGQFYVEIRTDLTNNIIEDNEANNTGFSSNKVHIGVLNLPMNDVTPALLKNNDELYYRLNIPDSLAGQTILVSLYGDSLDAANELYIRYANVPTRTIYDYAYDKPLSGSQGVVIPVADSGSYYLLIYGASNKQSSQSIQLLAQKISFSVFDVNAREGGNTGLVTVRISGAKFDPSMSLHLHSATSGDIPVYSIQYISSTAVFATFNLNGAKTGLYDMVATKSAEDTAVLHNGFSIIKGSGAGFQGGGTSGNGFYCKIQNTGVEQLTGIDLQYPPSVNVRRGMFTMTINFGNSGNVDIPLPHKILVSLSGTPVSLTQAGISEGRTQLYLEFKELNGPEGILRPGATGSITIYALPVRGLFGYKLIE